jgi:hypothetical protein
VVPLPRSANHVVIKANTTTHHQSAVGKIRADLRLVLGGNMGSMNHAKLEASKTPMRARAARNDTTVASASLHFVSDTKSPELRADAGARGARPTMLSGICSFKLKRGYPRASPLGRW